MTSITNAESWEICFAGIPSEHRFRARVVLATALLDLRDDEEFAAKAARVPPAGRRKHLVTTRRCRCGAEYVVPAGMLCRYRCRDCYRAYRRDHMRVTRAARRLCRA